MTGKIVITGISEAEKAAKEILEHIQAIKDIQRRMVWFGSDTLCSGRRHQGDGARSRCHVH